MEDKINVLDTAIAIARRAHRGQTDLYGAPYLLHPMRVMDRGRNEDERIVGILHDVVEDTNVTIEALRSMNIPEHILTTVDLLTKRDDEDYDDYIRRLAPNALARAVKLNDLMDNMDVRRLPHVGEKEAARLNKYLSAYRYLMGTDK